MRSYFEILNELMEAIEADEMMPQAAKDSIKAKVRALLDLLWKYSD